jgi:hypothetical protein
MTSEDDTTCEICYTNDKSIVLCWNDHQACAECRDAMWTMRDCFGQVKKTCGFCREPLFDWGASGLRDPSPSHHRLSADLVSLRRAMRMRLENQLTSGEFQDILNEYLDEEGVSFASWEWDRMNWTEDEYAMRRRRQTHIEIASDRSRYSLIFLTPPLVHRSQRLWDFGTILSCSNGKIVGLTNELDDNHPDFQFVNEHQFTEDQLFNSPNFVQQLDNYRYVGRKGSWAAPPNSTLNCSKIPFPQKNHHNRGFPQRCGHCRQMGHTASWETPEGRPKFSVCPKGNSKLKFQNFRVDREVFVCL